MEMDEEDSMLNLSSRFSVVNEMRRAEEEERNRKRPYINYGEKIKTYRLINNELKRVIEAFG